MASPAGVRPSTATPTSRVLRDDKSTPRKGRDSPYRHSPHRSSPQILVEELSHLRLQEDRAFRQFQDDRDAEQEKLHQKALAVAAAEHERVRLFAVRAAERSELEQERQRKQREEEEHRALEAERTAKSNREAEERRRRKEDLERQEEEQRKRAAEEREIQEAQNRLTEQKRKDEEDAARRKKEQEDADRKARQEAAAAEAAQKEASQPVQPPPLTLSAPTPATHAHQPVASQPPAQALAPVTQTPSQPAPAAATQPTTQHTATTSAMVSPAAQREALHNQYLAIHKRLKVMRQEVVKKSKAIPELKAQLGNWRRELNTTMGQFATGKKVENREKNRAVIAILSKAAQYTEPSVNVVPLIAGAPEDSPERKMSGPLVYLLNIAAKSAIRQSIAEAARGADPIATVIATLFSKPDFKLDQRISLIDIVIAKYHVVCPALFGINGSEKTAAGRHRLAWWTENGNFIPAELHSGRMAGIARGYACLALRDFSHSTMINPFPPTNYWKTLSYIVNTPSAELQSTHFIVLKALIEGNLDRFIKCYGQAALVALRQALVELPRRAPPGAARDVVAVMPQTLQREKGLTL